MAMARWASLPIVLGIILQVLSKLGSNEINSSIMNTNFLDKVMSFNHNCQYFSNQSLLKYK